MTSKSDALKGYWLGCGVEYGVEIILSLFSGFFPMFFASDIYAVLPPDSNRLS